jgi:cobalt/nickel transport system permease protein
MLDARTWIPAWLGSAGALAWALRRVRTTLNDSAIVMMAVMSALIFVLQMLNFPVAGGTSGHFAGGAAAAIVLGLWPAVVVMAAVVTIQALFFADGGITALGANMLTIAIIGPLVGSAISGALARFSTTRSARMVAAFVAAWFACVASALGAGVLLWIAGRAPLAAALGAMGLWHALIGIGEGAITAGLVGYLLAVRPDLLDSADRAGEGARGGRRTAVAVALLCAAAVTATVFASANPDGLERAYEQVGAPFRQPALLSSPVPGYLVPGVSNEALATVLAAAVGVIITGGLAYTLLTALRGRRTGGSE